MVRKLLGAAAVVLMSIGLMAGTAHGGHAPPANHDHFLTVPGADGKVVRVGPHVCDNPNLHNAFHKFHANVHVGAPTGTGVLSIAASPCS